MCFIIYKHVNSNGEYAFSSHWEFSEGGLLSYFIFPQPTLTGETALSSRLTQEQTWGKQKLLTEHSTRRYTNKLTSGKPAANGLKALHQGHCTLETSHGRFQVNSVTQTNNSISAWWSDAFNEVNTMNGIVWCCWRGSIRSLWDRQFTAVGNAQQFGDADGSIYHQGFYKTRSFGHL